MSSAADERSEMERRWDLVRTRLRDRQADALVLFGELDMFTGPMQWLTKGGAAYRKVVVFDADELMTVYEHGGAGVVRQMDGTEPGRLGVGTSIGMSTFQAVEYTAKYEAEAVCELARKRGYRRIALCRPNSASHGFVSTLREALPNVDFIDETEFLDRCQAVKSPWEIARIESGAAMQDETFKRLVEFVEPGKRDSDVAAYTYYQARTLGGFGGIVMSGAAPIGKPAYFKAGDGPGRIIEAGDYMSVLVEVGFGGYYLELGRAVSIGAPDPELVDLYEQAKEAQAFTVSLMKPGAKPAEIYAAYTDHMASIGQAPELRLFSHGQGYDFIQRPLIRWDETMVLEEGMNIAVHPSLTKSKAGGTYATLCDQVIIEADGARMLHKTPRQIFQV